MTARTASLAGPPRRAVAGALADAPASTRDALGPVVADLAVALRRVPAPGAAEDGGWREVAATAARGQEALAALQDRADVLDAASVDAVTAVHLLLRTLGSSPRTAGGTA